MIVVATVVFADDLVGSCCIAADVDKGAAADADHGIDDSVFVESMSSSESEVVAVRVVVTSVGIAAVVLVVGMTLSDRCSHCCCSYEHIPVISRIPHVVLIRDPQLESRRPWSSDSTVNRQQRMHENGQCSTTIPMENTCTTKEMECLGTQLTCTAVGFRCVNIEKGYRDQSILKA